MAHQFKLIKFLSNSMDPNNFYTIQTVIIQNPLII